MAASGCCVPWRSPTWDWIRIKIVCNHVREKQTHQTPSGVEVTACRVIRFTQSPDAAVPDVKSAEEHTQATVTSSCCGRSLERGCACDSEPRRKSKKAPANVATHTRLRANASRICHAPRCTSWTRCRCASGDTPLRSVMPRQTRVSSAYTFSYTTTSCSGCMAPVQAPAGSHFPHIHFPHILGVRPDIHSQNQHPIFFLEASLCAGGNQGDRARS